MYYSYLLIENMLNSGECQNIEYKESLRDEYLKWVCWFANAQGGRLYIGVKDNLEIICVADSKKLMEDIPNKIVSQLGIVCETNLLNIVNAERMSRIECMRETYNQLVSSLQ